MAEILLRFLNPNQIQIAGLVVSEASSHFNHWSAAIGLSVWLKRVKVPALMGIDTRALTKRLRDRGTMLGKLVVGDEGVGFHDPNKENLVSLVSVKEPVVHGNGKKRVIVIDCGCKHSILRCLLARDVTIIRVPWNYDFLNETYDGVHCFPAGQRTWRPSTFTRNWSDHCYPCNASWGNDVIMPKSKTVVGTQSQGRV